MQIDEAKYWLEFYKDWNPGQKSLNCASGGIRTVEDDIYEARRRLLLFCTRLVAGFPEDGKANADSER
jgi:hypothetical protein